MPRRSGGTSSSDTSTELKEPNWRCKSRHCITKNKCNNGDLCLGDNQNCTKTIEGTQDDIQKSSLQSVSTHVKTQKVPRPVLLNKKLKATKTRQPESDDASSDQQEQFKAELVQPNSVMLKVKLPQKIGGPSNSTSSIELKASNDRRRLRHSVAKIRNNSRDQCFRDNPNCSKAVDDKNKEVQKSLANKVHVNSTACVSTPKSTSPLDKKLEASKMQQHKSEDATSVHHEPLHNTALIQHNSRLLEDVVAYVEVRDGNEDHSEACAIQLELLGATIVKNFTRRVTHVFFRNGRKGTYERAKNWNIPLLSALWIEKCKQDNVRACENDYPALIPTEYTSPYFFGKIKRFRSMQPKAWKEPKDIVKTLEQREKRKKQRQFAKSCKNIMKSLLSPSRASSTDQTSSLLTDKINAISPATTPLQSRVMTRSPDLLDLLEDEEDNIALSQESTWNVPLVKRIFLQSPALKRIREKDNETNELEQSPNSSLNASLRTMQLLGLDTDSIEDYKSYANNSAHHNSPHNVVDKEKRNYKTTVTHTKSNVQSKVGSVIDKLKPNFLSKDLHTKQKIRPELKENCQVKLFSGNLESDLVGMTPGATPATNSNPAKSPIKNVTIRKRLKCSGKRLFSNPSSLLTDIVLATETPEAERRGIKRSLECTAQGTSNLAKFVAENDCTKLAARHSLDDFDIARTKKAKIKKNVFNQPSVVDVEASKKRAPVAADIKKTMATVPNNCDKKTRTKTSASRKLIVDLNNVANNHKNFKAKRLPDSKPTAVLPSIVTTSVCSDEQEAVHAIIDSLGGFCVLPCVDITTSHVVSSDNRRTLNVLFAIAQGCWLVSKEWIYKSMEAERWVDEEPYELFDAFPAAQLTRLERSVLGDNFSQKLLQDAGAIYVADDTTPPSNRLKELITLTGGKVVPLCRQAKICIGKKMTSTDVQCVAPKWIFDCITENAVLPLKNYLVER